VVGSVSEKPSSSVGSSYKSIISTIPVGSLCVEDFPFRNSPSNAFLPTGLKRSLYFRKYCFLPGCTGAGPEGPD
jgi:hypothetical protein